MTPEAKRLWMQKRVPKSRWRREAIVAIGRVLMSASPDLLADDDALLKAVDAAYPFGERKYLPYKMWLLERKLFREAMVAPAGTPSSDEAGVCEVAGDLVQLGRIDEARRLLEQAPNRLGRKCPACAMPVGTPCIDMSRPPTAEDWVGAGDNRRIRPGWRDMIVPHQARLAGGHPGPLFRGAP